MQELERALRSSGRAASVAAIPSLTQSFHLTKIAKTGRDFESGQENNWPKMRIRGTVKPLRQRFASVDARPPLEVFRSMAAVAGTPS